MKTYPQVLLAGDSISFGYGPKVAELLVDELSVGNLPRNGGTSENLLDHIGEWMVEPGYDIIHFNCGLHDLALVRETGLHRVPPDSYRRNLGEIVEILAGETEATLVWASTTPVVYNRHRAHKDFDRREKDVLRYNKIARSVMADQGVVLDDLHRVVEEAGRERCVGEDGVHMTENGYDLLSRAVARLLRDLVGD